ncbi:MAG: 3-oxoacid CoA-transferase subunit B [Firmicutes bacterium]|jgi:acetate CoA/acetoacetate CoA-transferase beta subunit|nr:3-oxoacid CoA-transferase subunit B [Bacillota bacterium]
MSKSEMKNTIARRVAKELKDGDVVNLGIGLPTLVANFIPSEYDIMLHSENGFIGLGKAPEEGQEKSHIVNAGGQAVTIKDDGAFFDSSMSFSIIRGGHLDVTVLGALQVDEKGNLANWMIPGKMVPGMGGAMDLVAGAKKVIVAMEHTAKGNPKILKECNLPLTGAGKVDMIITEKCVLKVTDNGLELVEVMDGSSVEDVIEATEANIIVPEGM